MESNNKYHRCVKVSVFILTFMCYVGLHSMRTGWSFTKSQIEPQVGKTFLAAIDTTYLLCYSLGMATIGTMTNRLRLNWYIGAGMIAASLCFSAFPLTYVIQNTYSKPIAFVFMGFNGFFQSTGWPGMMATIGNWYGKGKRGMLLAFWSINANIGNIVGLLMCTGIKDAGQPWSSNLLATAILSASIGFSIILFLQPKPKFTLERDSLITEEQNVEGSANASVESASNEPAMKQLNIFTAFFVPRVPLYVISYSMLKGCMYGLLFWLPTYLQQMGLASQKGYISSMVDVGAFVGGMIVGRLGDKYQLRALFLSPLLFLGSVVMIIVCQALHQQALPYYFLMFLVGALTGGPYNVIGSAIAIDLGKHPSLKGQKRSVSVISALVQGTAAIFSAVSQLIIPQIPFNLMFLVFCVESLVASLTLMPLFVQDWKKFQNNEVDELAEE